MEWSNDLVFQLIEEYRKRPLLWDTSDNCYKIHSKKNDAWAEIATIMGTDISEVKKKINSLLASYRRERQKITTKHELYMETYPSTWFAFQKFDFLTDIYTPRKRLNPLFQVHFDENQWEHQRADGWKRLKPNAIPTLFKVRKSPRSFTSTRKSQYKCEDPEEQQNIEGVMEMKLEVLEEDGNKTTPNFKPIMLKKRPPSESEYPPRKRRPTTDDDLLETRSFEVLPRDDCSVYGEHIANEIRKLSHRAQNKVKHLINNIIYDAQMGMYDNPQASPRTSSQTSPTPPALSSHFEDSISNENDHSINKYCAVVKQEELSD